MKIKKIDMKYTNVADLKVKIFADGADKAGMLEMASKSFVKGLTTNPTLMKKAGILDYRAFALEILSEIKEKPISFEVFSEIKNNIDNKSNKLKYKLN